MSPDQSLAYRVGLLASIVGFALLLGALGCLLARRAETAWPLIYAGACLFCLGITTLAVVAPDPIAYPRCHKTDPWPSTLSLN